MAQVYAQLDQPASAWLLEGTETSSRLMLATATVCTYNSGAPDTLPALTAAIVDGGSSTNFDTTAANWVAYTVQGSAILRLANENALPTTGTYALLARVSGVVAALYQQA